MLHVFDAVPFAILRHSVDDFNRGVRIHEIRGADGHRRGPGQHELHRVQAEAEWLQTHRSFPQVAGELDPQAVYQGADYRFSVERAILLDTHTGLRLDCLLRVSWRNPWLPPPNAGALLRAEDDRGNEYPQFQNRPFLTGRYLHGGPLPGASPLPVRYYELSICQVDPKAETITLLLDPFGAVEARLTIPLREEKAHG